MVNYISILEPKFAFPLIKFRTGNHKLPVETGRYVNVEHKNRVCPKCKQEVGDEFHYLFTCSFFTQERRRLVQTQFSKRPNMYTFRDLLGHTDRKVLEKLSVFVKLIMQSIR